MRSLINNPNVDNSDAFNYPSGRIKDNTGSGDGTPVNERVKGDLHQAVEKLMRLYSIAPNDLPDNETNGFQIVDALRALSSKNTIVNTLGTSGGILQVPIKLGFLLTGEVMICKANVTFTTETQIQGQDVLVLSLTVVNGFSSGDYVQLIRTVSGIEIRRIVDQSNLDVLVGALNYLKKASQAQENAGTVDTVATTPLSNLTAFIRRVNGIDSSGYLATLLINGLYPKEHFAIVAGIGANPVKNIGWVSGIDIEGGAVGNTFAVSGQITSCTLMQKADNTCRYRVVLQNNQNTTNYYVRSFIQGQSPSLFSDNTIGSLIFQPINQNTFDFTIAEFVSKTQNLKIHFEVVNI